MPIWVRGMYLSVEVHDFTDTEAEAPKIDAGLASVWGCHCPSVTVQAWKIIHPLSFRLPG